MPLLLVLVGSRYRTALLWLLLLSVVEMVKKESFRQCASTGFCARLRGRTVEEGEETWRVTSASVREGIVSLGITNERRASLVATIKAYEGGMVRVSVDEKDRSRPRFRAPEGEIVLDKELRLAKLQEISGKAKDMVSYTTGKGMMINVRVRKNPMQVEVLQGTKVIVTLNREKMFDFERGASEPETFLQWKDTMPNGKQAFAADLVLMNTTHVMGIPEHATDLLLKATMDRRDKRPYGEPYRLYNLDVFEYELNSPMALYGAIPFLIGFMGGEADQTAKGVFWNNPSETFVDIYGREPSTEAAAATLLEEREKLVQFMSEAGIMDVFVFVGPGLGDVLRQYYQVTGKPYLPPLFSIGYHQCRWNYMDREDLLDVNSMFEQKKIPVDVLWLDIEHTDGKKYFSWDKEAFPDPVGMERRLRGRKLVLIVDPHMKRQTGYKLYDELKDDPALLVKDCVSGEPFEGECWPGNSVWPDFINPLTRIWWRKQLVLGAHEGYGEDTFVWNDMNEPSVFSGPEVTMPKDMLHLDGAVEHREVHNLYGHYMHRATFEGLLSRDRAKVKGQKRPFVLTRAFFAGSQRFGAAWTGDNVARWDHLKASIPMILALSVSGMPFVGADVGGFFGNPEAELLTRWYQVGALQPFFRAHAHIETMRREPWLIAEPYQQFIKKAILMRYQLLPYIYGLFVESSRGGRPINRPLFMEFPREREALQAEDQFMVGGSLLVKAITQAKVRETSVILPGDQPWYDYWSLEMMARGEREARMGVVMERIPVFIRGGSVIFRKEWIRRSASLTLRDPYTMIIAPDGKGEANGTLYVDDGVSVGGPMLEVQMSWRETRLTCKAMSEARGGPGGPGEQGEQGGFSTMLEKIMIAMDPRMVKSVSLIRGDGGSKTILLFKKGKRVLTVRTLPLVMAKCDWQIVLN